MAAYTAKTDEERLFELAWHMQEQGNKGWYSNDIIKHGDDWSRHIYCNPLDIPQLKRRDILYYSTGRGWRVRKKPHWFEVFRERFPETVKGWCDGST